MRDPELMISLLKEMSEDNMGQLIIPMRIGMGVPEQQRHHHVALLVDAGHATWMSGQQSVARITNDGYDFLNAATNLKHGEKATSRFVELFNGGVAYARAAQAAVDVVAKAVGV